MLLHVEKLIDHFFQKLTNLDGFRNKAIHHIKIRHEWWLKNGLNNAAMIDIIFKSILKCNRTHDLDIIFLTKHFLED